MEPETQKQTFTINTPTAVIIGSIIIAVAVFFSNGGSLKKELTPEELHEKQVSAMLEIQKDDYVRGNKEAEIIVYEYSDIDCPYCREFHKTMKEAIVQNDNVAWVYRHFPLDSLHPLARQKAEAVECIGSIGGEDAFWGSLDTMFEDESFHNVFDIEKISALAETFGVSKDDLQQCISDNTFSEKIMAQQGQATDAGAQGTPYSIIGDKDGKFLMELPGYVDTATMNQVLTSLNQEK
jgi:protein-disulfide isomerase